MNCRAKLKRTLIDRIRQVNEHRFGSGEAGLLLASSALGIPAATLKNFYSGVSVPAEFLLSFIEATGADAQWLLTGRGEPYRHTHS